MNIFLVRHGDAEDNSATGKDSDRKLTPQGEQRTLKNAQYLKNYIKSVDYIVTSPFIRAYQTAKILSEVLLYNEEIIVDQKLASGATTKDVIDIANYLDVRNIMFVGHQPDFSHILSDLISSSGAAVEFKKSAAAKISFSGKVFARKGVLDFLIPPVPEK